MMPKLSDELRQVLADRSGQPVEIEDPVTHARYVLVRLDEYERLRGALGYDDSDPDPRAFYPAFAKAIKDELDDAGVDGNQSASPQSSI